jgi:hypothetical protein
MIMSITDVDVRAFFERARATRSNRVMVGGSPVNIPTPVPAPENWRDQILGRGAERE